MLNGSNNQSNNKLPLNSNKQASLPKYTYCYVGAYCWDRNIPDFIIIISLQNYRFLDLLAVLCVCESVALPENQTYICEKWLGSDKVAYLYDNHFQSFHSNAIVYTVRPLKLDS